MTNKINIVYFGAAGCAIGYCKNTGTTPDIFVANNPEKWGTFLNGVEILAPSILSTLALKKIVVTSSYIKDIVPQILDLGIDKNIVEVPSKSLLSLKLFEDKSVRMEVAEPLYQIMTALNDEHKVVAVGGTALGFSREADFILWDDDIDLFAPIQARSELIKYLEQSNLIVKEMTDSIMSSILFYFKLRSGISIPVSVDFFNSDKETFVDTFEDYNWEWPTKMFTECHEIKVHGFFMNVPNPPHYYLSQVYGASWSDPNPDFGYSDYHGLNNASGT